MSIHRQNVIACIWDFDKTLIPGYMQTPLFERYDIDERNFWNEVQHLAKIYKHVSPDTVYLNHLISYIKNGPLKGLNNRKLNDLGGLLKFYPGLPEFFGRLKNRVRREARFIQSNIVLEHYIISTGLAEMIRGSSIAAYVDGIFGCEFIENPFPPGFLKQIELSLSPEREIAQIGTIVDNTIKTRFIFEINKGTNKNAEIDVNSSIAEQDRRIPIENMIYVADGPSDIPVFSVIKKNNGKAYAVYNPNNPKEFEQNDNLLQAGRVHAYGPADYTSTSKTAQWIEMHVLRICENIINKHNHAIHEKLTKPPVHIHQNPYTLQNDFSSNPSPHQSSLFSSTE